MWWKRLWPKSAWSSPFANFRSLRTRDSYKISVKQLRIMRLLLISWGPRQRPARIHSFYCKASHSWRNYNTSPVVQSDSALGPLTLDCLKPLVIPSNVPSVLSLPFNYLPLSISLEYWQPLLRHTWVQELILKCKGEIKRNPSKSFQCQLIGDY